MGGTRLLWRLYPTYLLITLVAVLAITLHATRALKHFYVAQVKVGLDSRAHLVCDELTRLVQTGQDQQVQQLCQRLGAEAATRITVIRANGKVIGDSEENPAGMDNHADRPEVMRALGGERGDSIRFSHTLQQEMAYVAIPMTGPEGVLGTVRVAVPLTQVQQELTAIYWRIALGSVIVALLTAGVAMLVARHISRPLERVKQGAERFAAGELTYRLSGSSTQEIHALAETMNQMAAELHQRIQTAERQRNELKAILASMVEGVLAVDTQKRVLSINRSAAELLSIEGPQCIGQSLEEAVRSPQLQGLVTDVLTMQQSMADEFALYTDTERFLHVQGAVLRDAEETLIGALVVLYDVTQLKRLENVRRDFVANVSHELKTPITSIKGYVETLLDGAMHHPEDAERFLRIVANQSDRLNSIIDDLLALSRVEQKAERAEIPLDRGAIRPVLQAAIEVSANKAKKCGVQIELQCDAALAARINAPLLEQAVTNLIDNACKHSPPGSTVWVEGQQRDDEVVISVRDRGCGIEAHHLPRLFERFYRVDKSRSRKLGGTGLGLAIVKHISQAHHGHVRVESAPDQGSTFWISLPLPDNED